MAALFETENVRVDFAEQNSSEIVVVSFAERADVTQSLSRPGFGQDFVRKLGLTGIFVKCGGNDWYQYPEMPSTVAAVLKQAAGRSIVTYGSSMGAYAALLFTSHLRAVRAVAISPQYSIDRRKMPSESRWLADSRRIRFIDDNMAIPPQCETFVLFDPFNQDAKHARKIQECFGHVHLVTAPFASHPVGHFLRQSGLLSEVMSSLLLGHYRSDHWIAARRARRTKSANYWRAMAEQAERRGWPKLAKSARQAEEWATPAASPAPVAQPIIVP